MDNNIQSVADYVREALRTESIVDAVNINPRTLHAVLGLSSEVGELMDAVKRHVYYGKTLDRVNLLEEAGDLLWYWALLVSSLDADPQQVLRANIDKLRKRYPDKFQSELAEKRDLTLERETLERYLDADSAS